MKTFDFSIPVKLATIKKCATLGKWHHPITRALNLYFGFHPDCQLVFRLYVLQHLREERLLIKLVCSGPGDGQKYEREMALTQQVIDKIERYERRRHILPFFMKISVTEDCLESIMAFQRYWRLPNKGITHETRTHTH